MKKIYCSLLFLLLTINFAYAQSSPSAPYIFVTKNNDTLRCTKAKFVFGNMKCDGKKIDPKTMIIGEYVWNLVPIDIDEPDGKQELRLTKVPKSFYDKTAKIAVVIPYFYTPGEKNPNPKSNLGDTPGHYDENPACFEFIKNIITQDLESLNIKPVIFIHDKNIYRTGIPSLNKNKIIIESGANVIMYIEFYKFPKNNTAEKNRAEVDDFSAVHLDIIDFINPQYSSESQYSEKNRARFTYRKTWRKFLIDYENSKPK